MAVQFHVAYSKSIMGAGIVAGGPFYCAEANVVKALGACMTSPEKIDVGFLTQVTKNTVITGTIDATSNMEDDMVFLISGTRDSTVKQGVMKKLKEYYENFVDVPNIKCEFSLPAEHAFVTETYGNSCGHNGSPFINDCDYDSAFHMLNHIYRGVSKPSSHVVLTGDFIEFDQSEFLPMSAPGQFGMASSGYIYVPYACKHSPSACKLHVVFHGCKQGINRLGDEYALNTGYNEIADENGIIILYPQATASAGNTNGCWDWWGYTGLQYACKLGPQMNAVNQMINRILS
ncbi:uncharacterized protein LOC117124069 isoform X2 [Anneissia japonica]|nr:uncharacterized protein LOC117124069 isoform X2 [Anneissia japonica]